VGELLSEGKIFMSANLTNCLFTSIQAVRLPACSYWISEPVKRWPCIKRTP